MEQETLPGCYTAKVLYDFDSVWSNTPTKKEIINRLAFLKKKGYAIVIATLTNKQTKTIKVLQDCKFYEERPIAKTRHPDTKLILFYYLLDELEDDFPE